MCDLKTKLARTALLMVAQFALPVHAEWFTVMGDRGDPTSDTVEVDPSVESAASGQKMVRVRVSYSASTTTRDGVPFQSYEAVAIFDCPKGTARFSRMAFYSNPLWDGRPHQTSVYSPTDIRPVEFLHITPNPGARIMRAACQSRTIATN